MADANKMVTHDEEHQSTSDSEHENESSRKGTQRPVAAFSVAQALSMVRQRREEHDRSRQEEEKQLEEQRREKAKEKRQRRRKNQKERKAKLREEAVDVADSSQSAVADVSEPIKLDEGCMNETNKHTVGAKRAYDHEADDDSSGQVKDRKDDDEINLKKLPVKKRLRLEASKEPLPLIATDGGNLNESKTILASATATKKVTSLIPRALLVKSSRQ